MHYGFIGLGQLGSHLALSLRKAGFDLTVHDLHRPAADGLLQMGASWAASPREVAAVSDAVITCLPSPAASTAVVEGNAGILAGLKPGGTWIEMSTTDAQELKRLAVQAMTHGINTLEAPVTGGVHRARVGEMAALVGGDEVVYQRHLPALQAMCGDIFHIGKLGDASLIKIITNMLACINLVGIGEALMLAKRGGLDLAQTYAVIKASSGNSFVHETESQVILNGSYNIGWTMDLACKDIGFAVRYGRDLQVPLELCGLVRQIFDNARQKYGGSTWSSQVVKLLEDAVGEDLRAPGFPAAL